MTMRRIFGAFFLLLSSVMLVWLIHDMAFAAAPSQLNDTHHWCLIGDAVLGLGIGAYLICVTPVGR